MLRTWRGTFVCIDPVWLIWCRSLDDLNSFAGLWVIWSIGIPPNGRGLIQSFSQDSIGHRWWGLRSRSRSNRNRTIAACHLIVNVLLHAIFVYISIVIVIVDLMYSVPVNDKQNNEFELANLFPFWFFDHLMWCNFIAIEIYTTIIKHGIYSKMELFLFVCDRIFLQSCSDEFWKKNIRLNIW